ncbi:MAG: hydroxyethylthiazole kinase [Clostridia bacterium]|nr:hydroxyethylthiazole kinase [Clostridia bacterium]
MLKELLENVRKTQPLVHNITNYVTVNDCANILLACGGSPIMSDDVEDVRDITAICSALNINIGTLNDRTIPAMFEAGKISNTLNHPVILDPVGAGASAKRTQTAQALINEIHFSVIRGNISEIKALAVGTASTKGVDADIQDAVTDTNIDTVVKFAREFSASTGAVTVITGAIDIISNDKKTYAVRNGHPIMSSVTGTGCMLSAITAAFASANPDNILDACLAAVCAMGLCGERAYLRLKESDGNSSYRNMLIDEMFNLSGKILAEGAKYEIM